MRFIRLLQFLRLHMRLIKYMPLHIDVHVRLSVCLRPSVRMSAHVQLCIMPVFMRRLDLRVFECQVSDS